MGKQNSRFFQDYSRTFFIFQGLNFFPIKYKTMQKMHIFSTGNVVVVKGTLVFFDSDSSDKNQDTRTNWIE